MRECVLVIWTCPHVEEAQLLIQQLLHEKLIACASYFPVESMFLWKGVVENSSEIKVFLKTRKDHFPKISEFLRTSASYEVSEILQIPIENGNPTYLEWVFQTCKKE